MFLLAIALIGVLCILPLTVQIDIRYGSNTQGRVLLQCWKLQKAWRWERSPGTPKQRNRRQMLQGLLHGDNRAWRYLLRHSRLMQLDILVLLRTGDAARSALLSGTLRSIAFCVPALHRKEIRMQILPEFFREHSTANLRCIIRLKAGTLILTAGLLGLKMLQTRRLNESEAMQYGTSHW